MPHAKQPSPQGAAPLTAAELKWLTDIQKLLDKCPSKRLRCYTSGDPSVTIFDGPARDRWVDANGGWRQVEDASEEHVIVERSGARLFELNFPFSVEAISA